jgi:hypothetical protein
MSDTMKEMEVKIPPRDMTLREFLDTHIAAIRLTFAAQGTIAPMFFGEDASGQCTVLLAAFENDAEKDAAAARVRVAFRDKNVIRYVFCSEAWALVVPSKTSPIPRPSRHPDRIEVVIVEAEDKSGKNLSAHMPIERKGETVTLGKPEYFGDVSSGRFVGLLQTMQ